MFELEGSQFLPDTWHDKTFLFLLCRCVVKRDTWNRQSERHFLFFIFLYKTVTHLIVYAAPSSGHDLLAPQNVSLINIWQPFLYITYSSLFPWMDVDISFIYRPRVSLRGKICLGGVPFFLRSNFFNFYIIPFHFQIWN